MQVQLVYLKKQYETNWAMRRIDMPIDQKFTFKMNIGHDQIFEHCLTIQLNHVEPVCHQVFDAARLQLWTL